MDNFASLSDFEIFDTGNNFTFNETGSPTPFPNRINLPQGFLDLNHALQALITYLILFPGVAFLVIVWWYFYPLLPDERVSFATLIASIWSVFILQGDYLSDVLVTLSLVIGDIQTTEGDESFDVKTFSRAIFAISTTALVTAILILAYVGKQDSELHWVYLPFRIVFVALGLYPFYLLIEIVTANYYGGMRAKLGDIVRLKYIQGTVEGIPQIGLLIYLNLQSLEGLRELVAASLFFSITSLVSGLVMWDFVRGVYDKEDFVESVNDVNYLFYSENLANSYVAHSAHASGFRTNYNRIFMDWLFHNLFTRFLECFARLGFYATFAICTFGWGLIGLVAIEVVLLLCYHRFVFFLSVWLELIFNVRDEGNVNIAYGEWKWKFITTLVGYAIIAGRLGQDSTLIDTTGGASGILFYIGLSTNLVLYPWIVYMFRRQRKINQVMENANEFENVENLISSGRKLEGIRSFDEEAEKADSSGNFNSVYNWFRGFGQKVALS